MLISLKDYPYMKGYYTIKQEERMGVTRINGYAYPQSFRRKLSGGAMVRIH